jgi:hypothetical protein
MAGPSVAWLCPFCRKAHGEILQAAHRFVSNSSKEIPRSLLKSVTLSCSTGLTSRDGGFRPAKLVKNRAAEAASRPNNRIKRTGSSAGTCDGRVKSRRCPPQGTPTTRPSRYTGARRELTYSLRSPGVEPSKWLESNPGEPPKKKNHLNGSTLEEQKLGVAAPDYSGVVNSY